ncbi:MAG TPA: helix-turn-helix transcriptional regulator [Steroidobacteraceae bacterium]|jgi:DNA-binding transcriptional ArsR family regulator|nr:helix-turn-helix transcriptional regulator [Steroidobacteraceae bacterium]
MRTEPRRRRTASEPRATSDPGGKLATVAPMFAALGDATRLQLLLRLRRDGAQSIKRLTFGGDVTRQAVTKHLQALERVRLVQSSRSGRERHWELQQLPLQELHRFLDQISGQWDEALARLRNLVED